MPIPTLTGMGPMPEFNDVVNKVNALVKELTNLMLNLDDANFDKITANVMDVNELSAITANMGKLTSGEIYGAYIATAEGAYPRAEMSNTSNLFGAYKDAANYIEIDSDYAGSPVINVIQGGTVVGQISSLSGKLRILGTTEYDIVSNGDVNVTPGVSNYLRVSSFSKIYSTSASQDLGTALGNKVDLATAFHSYGVNMAFDTGTRNLKLFAGDGTTLATVNIP